MRNGRTHGFSIATFVVVPFLWTAVDASALPYPCPTDPGFCYRDIGNDGCFDVGTDTGPINSEIEGATYCPAPVPGSIVCPPSVELLTVGPNPVCVETNPGSSILIYAAKIEGFVFEMISGDELLIGGMVVGPAETFVAENDLFLEKGVVAKTSVLSLESVTGNIVIGPNTRIKVRGTSMLAAGDITLLDRTNIMNGFNNLGGLNMSVVAGGTVEMTQPTIRAAGNTPVFEIEGTEVIVHGTASLKNSSQFGGFSFDIAATPGDVTVDRLSLKTDTPLTISGTNVTIGVMQGDDTPRSRINQTSSSVNVLATDTIHIDNLRLRSVANVLIETTGTTAEVLNTDLVGPGGSSPIPTFAVNALGVGSTCDLTGTEVVKAFLTTNCDTVIGP